MGIGPRGALFKEFSPMDQAPGCSFNTFCQHNRRDVVPGKDAIDPAIACHSHFFLEFGDPANVSFSKVHDLNMLSGCVGVNPKIFLVFPLRLCAA